MEIKNKYCQPQILRRYEMEMEESVLIKGSIINEATVETAGQEVHSYDFSDSGSGFNTTWEDN